MHFAGQCQLTTETNKVCVEQSVRGRAPLTPQNQNGADVSTRPKNIFRNYFVTGIAQVK